VFSQMRSESYTLVLHLDETKGGGIISVPVVGVSSGLSILLVPVFRRVPRRTPDETPAPGPGQGGEARAALNPHTLCFVYPIS
jgi:hypothetical protein